VIAGRIAVVAAALAVLPPSLTAAAPAAPIDVVAAIPPRGGAGAAATVLVGRAGQVYAPVAPGRWARRSGGGVAVDLRAAVRVGPTDDVFAVGDDAPPYRFSSGAWRSEPVGNRGPAWLATSGPLPTLVIGRHVYTLDGTAWSRRASASHRITTAWAAGPASIVLATTDGQLVRWDGRRFATVRSPLPATDPIVALVGGSPSAVYGRARSGAWVRIDRASCARVALDRTLAGFEEHAAGPGPDGRLLLAGTVPGTGGARRAVLIRAERDRLVLASELPPVAAGDRVAVVVGLPTTSEVLVATRNGAVRVRGKTGTWAEGVVTAALPARPTRPGRPSGAPARTR
jgi:hypothetical protein